MKSRFHGKRIIWEKDEPELADLTLQIARNDQKSTDMTRERELSALLGFKNCTAVCFWSSGYWAGTYCDYFIRIFGPRSGERKRFGVIKP